MSEQEQEIVIPTDGDTIGIIYNCIIEHWRMPQYEEQLSAEDFSSLEKLREKIRNVRNNPDVKEIKLPSHDLQILVKAYEIGFRELIRGGDDFHPITGHAVEQGKKVLNTLKSYSSG